MGKASSSDADMMKALGGLGKGAPMDDMEADPDTEDDADKAAEGEPTEAFLAAFKEYESASDPDARASAFWAAVKECTEGYS